MNPVNTKSLFVVLCNTIEKLDKNEIDHNQANAMGKLVGQATNLLNYELKRSMYLCNPDMRDVHRNVELKNFDSIPEQKLLSKPE